MKNTEDATGSSAAGERDAQGSQFRAGRWTGYWEQAGYRFRTEWHLELRANGDLYGTGEDAAGSFTMCGEFDRGSGALRLMKLYANGNRINMEGTCVAGDPPTISGTWYGRGVDPGPFLLQPASLSVEQESDAGSP